MQLMTPTELIDAANMGCMDGHAAQILANHILATVRADDNEPVTYDWLVPFFKPYQIGASKFWALGPLEFAEVSYFGDGTTPIADDWVVDHEKLGDLLVPRTRGQFRTLCWLLGIILPEATL
jgi:hypothetical protein